MKAVDSHYPLFGTLEVFGADGQKIAGNAQDLLQKPRDGNWGILVPKELLERLDAKIGDSILMMNDEYPDFGARSPAATGGSPVAFRVLVPDADKAVERAVQAGATLMREVQDQFYGDRSGMVACPFGYRWFLATPKEVLSPEEMQKRWTKMMEG